MAGHNGRELTIDWDAVTLVGVRSKTVARNNEMVDVTTDDDNGWRTLLPTPGVKAVDVSVSGITSDAVLIAEFYNASVTGETLETNPPASFGSETGTFLLSSIETTGEHDGALEFSATLQSTGAVTYTAPT